MSVGYVTVQWTRNKRVYDFVIAGGVLAYLAVFFAIGKLTWGGQQAISDEILLIRALATCAITLLHVVLCIGPLARLNPRFLPLLYNRRHLGVTTFLVAALHGLVVLGYYHGYGRVNPLVSLFTNDVDFLAAGSPPFQILGVAALVILAVLAATSHDFWLKNLSARTWKSIHMSVYACYALVIAHVAFGALQSERSTIYPILLALGVATVTALHCAAGMRERRIDSRSSPENAWVDLGDCREIPDGRARSVCVAGQPRIAVFRSGDRISAVRGVCAHQGGPLAEGRIIDGCITCPWHGWQYRPADGQSPPPFQEKIVTYQLHNHAGRVMLDPAPLPPGTSVEPARIGSQPNVN